jgi:hypothetical protein
MKIWLLDEMSKNNTNNSGGVNICTGGLSPHRYAYDFNVHFILFLSVEIIKLTN